MDRRMLAIGAVAIALGAVGCGDSIKDKASELPAEVEIEAAAEAAPNSGTLEGGVPVEGTDRSDAAQSRAFYEQAATKRSNAQTAHTDRSDAAQGTSNAETP